MATGDVTFDFQNFRTTLPSGMIVMDWAEGDKRQALVRKINFLFAFLTAQVQTGKASILGGTTYANLIPHVEIWALQLGLGCGVVPEPGAIYRWWLRTQLKFDDADEVYTWETQPFVVKLVHKNVSFRLPKEVTAEIIDNLYYKESKGARLSSADLSDIDRDLQLLEHLLSPEAKGGVGNLRFEIDPGDYVLCA